MEKIIEMKNVSKVYSTGEKEFKALDSINLELNKGDLVVVLGPSGAGKSTLLNLIGGMDVPTSGSIKIDGEEISKYNNNQLSEYRADSVYSNSDLSGIEQIEGVEVIQDKEALKTRNDGNVKYNENNYCVIDIYS